MTDDELGDRLDHIIRPRLPWRTSDLTECGRDAANHPAITVEEFIARVRKFGQQRTAFTTCITCANRVTYGMWKATRADPSLKDILARECARQHENLLLERELEAIVALIEAHRDEFDGLIAGLGEVTHLTERRRQARPRRTR